MSYLLEAVRKVPIALWSFSDAAPFPDLSGYDNTFTVSSEPAKHCSLGYGSNYSSIFSSNALGSFHSPVYTQGYEGQSFSIATAVRVIGTPTSPITIVGHPGRSDGLIIDGTVVSFTTDFLNTGSATASFDTITPRALFIVVTHSKDKNSIYVDGELVAEVDINVDQQNDIFSVSSDSFCVGQGTGTDSIAVDSVAIYSRILSGRDVQDLFNAAKKFDSNDGVYLSYGGQEVELSLDRANIFTTQTWQSESDWLLGMNSGLIMTNGSLNPQVNDAGFVGGTWMTIFSFDKVDSTSIYGLMLSWEGSDVVVETSLDGQTWTAAENNKLLSSLPENFDPTNQLLEIRVSFNSNPDAFLDSLTIVGLETGTIQEINGRLVEFSYPTSIRNYTPLTNMDDSSGILMTESSLSIGALDTPVGTQEYWIKRLDDTAVGITSNGGDVYINGQPSTLDALNVGEWSLVHISSTALVSIPIVLSGSLIVERAITYPTALSAGDINSIYRAYFGRNPMVVEDKSDITMIKSVPEVDIYAFDWTIVGSG